MSVPLTPLLVQYRYAAKYSDEVDLYKGDVVEGLALKGPPGRQWWYGLSRHVYGIFPANFVVALGDGGSAGRSVGGAVGASTWRDPSSSALPPPPAGAPPSYAIIGTVDTTAAQPTTAAGWGSTAFAQLDHAVRTQPTRVPQSKLLEVQDAMIDFQERNRRQCSAFLNPSRQRRLVAAGALPPPPPNGVPPRSALLAQAQPQIQQQPTLLPPPPPPAGPVPYSAVLWSTRADDARAEEERQDAMYAARRMALARSVRAAREAMPADMPSSPAAAPPSAAPALAPVAPAPVAAPAEEEEEVVWKPSAAMVSLFSKKKKKGGMGMMMMLKVKSKMMKSLRAKRKALRAKRKEFIVVKSFRDEARDEADAAELEAIAKIPKSPAARALIGKALKSHFLFANITDGMLSSVISVAEKIEVGGIGSHVVTQGETGDRFYIVDDGTLSIAIDGKVIGNPLKSGDYFGDLALLHSGAKRAATVATTSPSCVLWALRRRTFKNAMGRSANNRMQQLQAVLQAVLQGIPTIKALTTTQRRTLAQLAKERSVAASEVVVQRGEVCDVFHIVKKGGVQSDVVQHRGKGECFGESAVQGSSASAWTETVRANDASGCELYTFSRDAVLAALGALDVLSANNLLGDAAPTTPRSANRRSSHGARASAAAPARLWSAAERATVRSIADVDVLRVLGVGSFGRVKLVRPKGKEGPTFALKTVQKRLVMMARQVEQITLERSINLTCAHPFVVGLFCSFHDRKRIYLGIELAPGGELCTLLDEKPDGLSAAETAFYAAGVGMAIAHIQSNGFVWRDLKPENVLIGEKGYPKACDFGISKKMDAGEHTYTICGTVHYMAPEIISQSGHGYAVDFWALGIFIYECINGLDPFAEDDSMMER